MRIVLLACVLITGLMACSGRKLPKGILEPEKMEAVMWDMLRAGEMLNGYILYRDTMTNAVLESQRWYQKIYDLHGTTKEEFMRSYEYYREHPDLSRALFDSLARYEEKKEPVDTSATSPANDTTKKKLADTISIIRNDTIVKRLDSFGNRRFLVDTAKIRTRKLERIKKDGKPPVQ